MEFFIDRDNEPWARVSTVVQGLTQSERVKRRVAQKIVDADTIPKLFDENTQFAAVEELAEFLQTEVKKSEPSLQNQAIGEVTKELRDGWRVDNFVVEDARELIKTRRRKRAEDTEMLRVLVQTLRAVKELDEAFAVEILGDIKEYYTLFSHNYVQKRAKLNQVEMEEEEEKKDRLLKFGQ